MAYPWYMRIWEQWISVLDAFTCDWCRSLHGQLFKQGVGPYPWLHPHCRCKRIFHHIEYMTEEPMA